MSHYGEYDLSSMSTIADSFSSSHFFFDEYDESIYL